MEIAVSELYDSQGERLWRGPPEERKGMAGTLDPFPGIEVIRHLSGLAGREPAGRVSCSRGEVLALAERLDLVSRDGAAPGFLTLLPRATLVESVARSFNRPHLRALGAVRMDFPLVFNLEEPGFRELTASYERQDRMFRLGPPDDTLRLAYAADPGLFGWLRGKRLRRGRLPFAIFSPTPVFRRLQSGEVAGLDRLRQYSVPDLHVLCAAEDGYEHFLRAVELAAGGARFWFGAQYAQFIDVASDALQRYPRLGIDAARAAGTPTLVNVLVRRPRYYGWRSGILVHGGFAPLMLYNLQWDDTNPQRFDLEVAGGGEIVVIHATVAGGWPKLLPLSLGRGLSGLGPACFPVEMAWHQLVLLPITDRHVPAARQLATGLEPFLRVAVDEGTGRPLGARLEDLRNDWQPCHAVIGDRESAGEPIRIEWTVAGGGCPIDIFLQDRGDRFARCRVEDPTPPGRRSPF